MTILKLYISPAICFFVGIVINVFNLSWGTQIWQGEMLLSVDWVFSATFLAAPPITMALAYDVANRFRPSNQGVLSLPHYFRSGILRLLFFDWMLVSVGFLVALIFCLGQAHEADPSDRLSLALRVLCGFMVLLGYLLIGAAIGMCFGRLVGVMMSIVSSIAVGLGGMSPRISPFSAGGSNVSLAGVRYPESGSVIQLIVLVVIGSMLLWSLFTRHRNAAEAVSVIAIGIALLSPLVMPGKYAYADPAGLKYHVCTSDSGAETCVRTEHQRWLPVLHEAHLAMRSPFQKVGVKLPTKLVEELNQPTPSEPGMLYWLPSNEELSGTHSITAESLVPALTRTPWCTRLFGENPPGETYVRNVELVLEQGKLAVAADSEFDKISFLQAFESLQDCKGI